MLFMNGVVNVAVTGAGNMATSPALIASLASYFGERKVEIRLYDADEERLDLFDRFARVCFTVTKATHDLVATSIVSEALDGADRVIVSLDENCARKYLKAERKQGIAMLDDVSMLRQAIEDMLGGIPPDADVLSLLDPTIAPPISPFRVLEWPISMEGKVESVRPLQVLRWINGEEFLHEILKQNEKSPIAKWLDDPTAVPFA